MSEKKTIILAVIMAFLASFGAFNAAGAEETADQPRVAIVLGHFPADTDVPTPVQTARCLKAFELYSAGAVNRIVVTGGYTREHISEARMMKIALVAYGVPEEDVIEETLAASTIENALFSKMVFDSRGWKKRAILISQKGHLWRAGYNFKDNGFRVKDAAADETPAPGAFAPLLEKERELVKDYDAARVGRVIVYEPYESLEPVDYPPAAMSRRLRAAAALYHSGAADSFIVYSDWYMRGPVDLAEMMKIALVSLGVPPDKITTEKNIHYGKFAYIARKYGAGPALLITAPEIADRYATELIPGWKFVYID